jgi:hypothetical protein
MQSELIVYGSHIVSSEIRAETPLFAKKYIANTTKQIETYTVLGNA